MPPAIIDSAKLLQLGPYVQVSHSNRIKSYAIILHLYMHVNVSSHPARRSHTRREGLATLHLIAFLRTNRVDWSQFIQDFDGRNCMASNTCEFRSYSAIVSSCVYTACVCSQLIRLHIHCVRFKARFLRNAIKPVHGLLDPLCVPAQQVERVEACCSTIKVPYTYKLERDK